MTPNPTNVLLIGGGGREHALALALSRSPSLGTLHITHPSNPGIGALGTPVDVPVDPKELYRLNQYCDQHAIGLVVIGPEDPLASGFADALSTTTAGAPRAVFGPSKAAAQLEADKSFSKHIMRAASVPTAEGRVFTSPDAAADYLKTRDEPQVIKACGLAKGKGVIVPANLDEGLSAINALMVDKRFGSAGAKLLIEERLTGPEVSVLALCDGTNILTLPPCQDHKRLLDDDRGPNTGGMGAYCPSPIDDDTLELVERDVLVPTIDALRREDIEFRGVLYAGLMLTPAGPKVLEFNVRFGDPECQPLMARLRSDALELFYSTATGRLDQIDVEFSDHAAVCLVLASPGYPDAPQTGLPITGVEDAESMDDITVHHAGTKTQAGELVTAGGRVLSVTALAPTLAEARDKAYAAADVIEFEGKQVRRDIARNSVRDASPTS